MKSVMAGETKERYNKGELDNKVLVVVNEANRPTITSLVREQKGDISRSTENVYKCLFN